MFNIQSWCDLSRTTMSKFMTAVHCKYGSSQMKVGFLEKQAAAPKPHTELFKSFELFLQEIGRWETCFLKIHIWTLAVHKRLSATRMLVFQYQALLVYMSKLLFLFFQKNKKKKLRKKLDFSPSMMQNKRRSQPFIIAFKGVRT